MDVSIPDDQAKVTLEAGNWERRHWERVLLTATSFLVVILLVITMALEIQVMSRNQDIKSVKSSAIRAERASAELKTAVDGSKTASEQALAALNKAIASSSTPSPFVQEIKDGLTTIKRIEIQMQLLTGGK